MNDVTADQGGKPGSRWRGVADRLARYGWLLLLVATVVALLGGLSYALELVPQGSEVQPVVDECENPPCFGGGGLPSLRDLPVVLPVMGYILVIALGLPSLLIGTGDFLRGKRKSGGQRVLIFVGPVLFFVGTEVIPHVLNPCLVSDLLGRRWLPGACDYGEAGGDFAGRWHLLGHTLIGAIPLAFVYSCALRRWRPDVARLP